MDLLKQSNRSRLGVGKASLQLCHPEQETRGHRGDALCAHSEGGVLNRRPAPARAALFAPSGLVRIGTERCRDRTPPRRRRDRATASPPPRPNDRLAAATGTASRVTTRACLAAAPHKSRDGTSTRPRGPCANTSGPNEPGLRLVPSPSRDAARAPALAQEKAETAAPPALARGAGRRARGGSFAAAAAASVARPNASRRRAAAAATSTAGGSTARGPAGGSAARNRAGGSAARRRLENARRLHKEES